MNTLTKMVSISEIVKHVQQLQANGTFIQQNFSLQKNQLKYEYAAIKEQRRLAQQRLSVNSVKLSYDNNDRNFGLSIGMKVPITKNSYESLLEKQQHQFDSIDKQQAVFGVSRALQDIEYQLLDEQAQWSATRAHLKKIKLRIARMRQSNRVDLFLGLKTEEQRIKLKQNKILVRAFQKYVNFLNISGVLGQQKNWLLASY